MAAEKVYMQVVLRDGCVQHLQRACEILGVLQQDYPEETRLQEVVDAIADACAAPAS